MAWVYLVNNHALDTMHIGDSLGKGLDGEVFLGTVADGTRYAVKKERIAKTSVSLRREVLFATSFANKQKTGFMHLYAYRILKGDPWQLQTDRFDDDAVKYLAKRAKFPDVVEKVYSYHEQVGKGEVAMATVAAQVVSIIQRMRKAGWAHRDLHRGNIVQTAKGVVAIDYSIIVHRTDVSEKYWDQACNDYLVIPDYLIRNHLWSHVEAHQINVPPWRKWAPFLRRHPDEWRKAADLVDCTDNALIARVGAAMWPRLHEEFVTGKHVGASVDMEVSIQMYARICCAAQRANPSELRRLLRKSLEGSSM